MTTVQQIYDEVCQTILEDGGAQFVYSESAFLKDLHAALCEFLQASGIAKKILCVQLKAGVAQYQLPVGGMEVQAAFADNGLLYDSYGFFMDRSDPEWKLQSGKPTSWRTDQLDANTIEISPAPSDNGREIHWETPMLGVIGTTEDPYDIDIGFAEPWLGTVGVVSGDCYVEFAGPMLGTVANIVCSDSNLAVIATAQPFSPTLTLDSVLELIPDSLAPYLVWSVLESLWTADGEAKDVQRGRYARARRVEGTNICKAISGADLLEKV